jgi:hypothetical protein
VMVPVHRLRCVRGCSVPPPECHRTTTLTSREQHRVDRSRPGIPRKGRARSLDRQGWMAAFGIWFGCCLPNRLADRAGRYRRLAAALAALPAPLLVMAVVLAAREPSSSHPVAVHLFLAGACLWLAVDLVRRGSVLDDQDRPVISVVAVLAALALMADLQPPGSIVRFGPATILVPVLVAIALAFAALVVAERCSDCLLAMLGRAALAGGAASLGAVELIQSTTAYPRSPVYGVALGTSAVTLLAMACFEARVLWRGVALMRLALRR